MWHVEVLSKQPDVAVTAVCDVWQERIDQAVAAVKDRTNPARMATIVRCSPIPMSTPAVIAPPPHWHTLIAVAACEAGKDIYLEADDAHAR